MGLWDKLLGKRSAKPRAREPSKRTWRLTWQDGALQLFAPHGTFRVKAIEPEVQAQLAAVAEGTDLLCEGEFDGRHDIEHLVVTAAKPAPALIGQRPPPAASRAVPVEEAPSALDRLQEALDALASVRWCEGTLAPAKLAVSVSGESAALDDVAWLSAHAEPAPFGHAGETKLDEAVRSTLRLRARGTATIRGLELAGILERIEEAFSLECRIEATLLDVLVYPPGGRFLRHKDTPRVAHQLGTLLVEVPVAHRGGDLVLVEGDDEHRVAWGTPGSGPRWVAFYGDVDHTVEAVESGTRVTLAYVLTASERPRTDPTLAAHLDAIADAAIALLEDTSQALPDALLVPCERLAIAPDDRTEPLTREMLRGHDAAIARTFERCGFGVRVAELVVASESNDDSFPEADDWGTQRLRRPIPASLFANIDAVSYEDDADTEEYGPMQIASIESYLAERDKDVEEGTWVIRRGAGAKLVHEGLFAPTGYFGNEASDGYLYLAATLVLKPPA